MTDRTCDRQGPGLPATRVRHSPTQEAGADDVSFTEEHHEIQTSPEMFTDVKSKLEAKGLPLAVAELSMIPTTEVVLDQRRADQTMKLMEALEDHDDVQNVFVNFEVSDAVMQKLAS